MCYAVKFTRNGNVVTVNIANRAELEKSILDRWASGDGFALATLNLDHLEKIGRDPAFAAAYARQDFVVADGRPVVWLARLAGRRLDLMPGSDLVLPLAGLAAAHGRAVALVGSTDRALADAAAALQARAPMLEVCARIAPPMGFDPDSDAAAALLDQVRQSGAGLCFLALGAPKQERLAARARDLAPGIGFASVGAGLDFLGGHQRRAPAILRILALEWLWRAATDPIRLAPRYARCFLILPELIRNARRGG